VTEAAKEVLDARDQFPEYNLATLYDPLATPPELSRAHSKLDRAVDQCYRQQPFLGDRQRVEHLFSLYQQIVEPLLPAIRGRRRRLG